MAKLPSVTDLPRDERQSIAALARAEIRHPVGAYDIVTLDGSHPLQHLLGEDSMPNNYNQRHAYDQEETMPPRGGRNFNDPSDPNETIDAEEAQARLQAIFDALDPGERPNMLAALQQFLEAQGASTAEADGTNEGRSRPGLPQPSPRRAR
jgi:hypothetical protein